MQYVNASAVVVTKTDKVLLVKHKQASEHINDIYGLPAGRLEPGEDAVHAAIRELKEETGLNTTELNLKQMARKYENTITRKTGIKNFVTTAFICTGFSGELHSSLETEPEWVNLANITKLNIIDIAKTIIDDAITSEKNL